MAKDESRLRPRRTSGFTDRVTIYVADSNRDVWERAERFAQEHGVSLSSLVAEALARYLESGAEQG